jgi:hypothetical protein
MRDDLDGETSRDEWSSGKVKCGVQCTSTRTLSVFDPRSPFLSGDHFLPKTVPALRSDV